MKKLFKFTIISFAFLLLVLGCQIDPAGLQEKQSPENTVEETGNDTKGTAWIFADSLALAGTPGDHEGVYAVDEYRRLVRTYHTGSGWRSQIIDNWGHAVNEESLISGHDRVYGITEAGRMFCTWIDNGVHKFSLMPDGTDLRYGSLALAGTTDDHEGIYGVDVYGNLTRFYYSYSSSSWKRQIIDSWGYDIVPGSLISGGSRVYGVTTSGRVFSTWINNGVHTFSFKPSGTSIYPQSLAMAGSPDTTSTFFAVDTYKRLVRFYYDYATSTSKREIIDTWGYQIDPDSLISGDKRVYGVTKTGRAFGTWIDNGVHKFSLKPSGQALIDTSLALAGKPESTNSYFGVDTNGTLVRFYYDYGSSSTKRQNIDTWGYSVHSWSLISDYDRVYGVTNGRICGTWNNHGTHTFMFLC